MIGKLTGIIDQINANTLILDVNGVGYVVSCGARTLAAIGGAGDKTSLYIETIVREDAITLYGFADAHEQYWFKTLTTVQGVGAKVCLSILSVCTPEQLMLAIGAKDHAILKRADGVGPKLAQRIVMELKDKAAPASLSIVPSNLNQGKKAEPSPAQNTAEDAISALINLGYARTEAYQAVNAVLARNDDAPLSTLISQSLKELAA